MRSASTARPIETFVVRPDRGAVFGPDVLEHGSAEHTRMQAIRTRMTIPPVMDDIAALLAFAAAHGDARPGQVGVHGELEIYPGVHHGFGLPHCRVYDKPAAERHWQRLIALYVHNLRR